MTSTTTRSGASTSAQTSPCATARVSSRKQARAPKQTRHSETPGASSARNAGASSRGARARNRSSMLAFTGYSVLNQVPARHARGCGARLPGCGPRGATSPRGRTRCRHAHAADAQIVRIRHGPRASTPGDQSTSAPSDSRQSQQHSTTPKAPADDPQPGGLVAHRRLARLTMVRTSPLSPRAPRTSSWATIFTPFTGAGDRPRAGRWLGGAAGPRGPRLRQALQGAPVVAV